MEIFLYLPAAKVAIIFKRWLMPRLNLLKVIVFCLLLIVKISGHDLYAQSLASGAGRSVSADSLKSMRHSDRERLLLPAGDTLGKVDSIARGNKLLVRDSLMVADSLEVSDSLAAPKNKGMLDFPVFSSAQDSTIEDFSGPHKMIYYYGGVKVTYGNMGIEADYMAYDVDKQLVFASGKTDSLGNLISRPKLVMDGQAYDVDHVYYNFGSRKAKVKNMITQQQEGILHGENLKMMPDKSINITQGKYTVCDLDHPHYYLKMTAAKIVTEPKQRTVFGPAYVVVADVPLPLILPFGFVPQKPARASGILFPTFGEEQARGFYMRDLGYYMVFGDHFDVALTTDIYTLGSWSVDLNSRYKLRYKFNGSLGLTYSVDQTGEKGTSEFFQSKNFSVKWSHSQDSKANPGTSFSASVNFASPSNNRYNANNINQALESQFGSSVSYSKTWSNMSLSVNGLHSQNTRDSSYSITLPNVTFNVNRFYPFKRKNRVGKERFYEQISFGYGATFQNKINFKAKEVKDPDFFSKLQAGMNHRFSIGLPSFTLLKYLNFSPGVSYGMNWHFQEQHPVYDPETDRVEYVKSPQYSTFGVSQDFSASLSMSTRIYGTFMFTRPNSRLKAIRHMITPSVSFSYKPEMGVPMNGYMTYTYTDKQGETKSIDYNKYAGGLYQPPGKGQTAGLSFDLKNNLEAKLLDDQDTTGRGTKKIKLIDNLGIRGSYNFLADSLKLSTLSISANTTVFEKIGINASMTLDPYAVDERGRKYNEFQAVKTKGASWARITNASASLSWSIRGEGKIEGNDGSGTNKGGGSQSKQSGSVVTNTEEMSYNKIYYHPYTGEYIPGGWVYYLNPNVPWQVGLNLNYSYSKSYSYANEQLQTKHNHTQTLSINGSVALTKAFNISVNTGLDLTKMKPTTTTINATYDLHCFNISVMWVPFGQWESWSFRIAAKASALADLLQYRKSSSYWDN